eukprot:6393022-Amphidinium_carterae.1
MIVDGTTISKSLDSFCEESSIVVSAVLHRTDKEDIDRWDPKKASHTPISPKEVINSNGARRKKWDE